MAKLCPETTVLPFHIADIGEAEIDAVVEVLRSGWLTTGTRAQEFETAFARVVGAKHAVALNSATAALHLALEAAGVCEGDEVIVPTLTFAASAEVVIYLRARPILVDCDPETLTLTAEQVERALTPKTRAVMPVHLGGLACEMAPILDLARAARLTVIEDAAHALPATYQGRTIGAIGDLTAFSFYATKTLTTGEGGMLTTDNEVYAARVRLMSLHGISRHAWNRYAAEGSWRYEILAPGYKYNLTDIAAAVGLAQLRRLGEMRAARLRIADAYDRGFATVPEIRVPARRNDVEHAWHLYAIRLQRDRLKITRDAFIEQLKTRGIGTSVHFIPLHLHPYYRTTFRCSREDCPNALAAADELVSLPIYPRMTAADVSRVIQAVSETVEENRR